MPNPRELAERAEFYKGGLDCRKICEIKERGTPLKKNRPCPKPTRADHWHSKCWREHRHRVAKAGSLTDTTCVKLSPYHFFKSSSLYNSRLACFVRIEMENALITKHLSQILRGKCKIDDELGPSIHKHNHSMAQTRLDHQLKMVKQNGDIARSLAKVSPTMSRRAQLDWYRGQEVCMEKMSKFPLFWKRRPCCKPHEVDALTSALEDNNPIVYLDFEVNGGIEQGRLVLQLYSRAAPVAVHNFRAICNGEGRKSFVCSKVDKIWPGIFFRFGRGAAGPHGPFPPEKFRMKHDDAGVVSLVRNGENLFDAEFMVTARELAPLDGQNLVIGRVVEGMDFLGSLEKYVKGHSTMTPVARIRVVKTGEMEPIDHFISSPTAEPNDQNESVNQIEGTNDNDE